MRLKNKTSKIIINVILYFLAVLWIIPIIVIFLTSFRTEQDIIVNSKNIWPEIFTFENYASILQNNSSVPVLKWFLNSLFISSMTTFLVLLVSSLAAYAYSRMNFKFKNLLFWILVGTMLVPSVINIVPLYNIISRFGLVNTPWSMILPPVSGVFSIFLIRQFMLGIPKDLEEAAIIDGAGEIKIFFSIILPLCKPILTVVGIMTFTTSWNDFLWPMIVTSDPEARTLTAGLQLVQGAFLIERGKLTAITAISAIPVIIIFIFVQKYFIQGSSISSGVKG